MRATRRWAPLALVLLAVLSGAGERLEAQDYRAVVRLRPRAGPIALDTLARPYEIEAPRGRVFGALREAFEAVGIPMEVSDSVRGVAGNERFVKRTSLDGMRLSRFFNCGSDMMGPNADRYRLTIAVAAFVDPLAGDRTRLGVAATAMGRSVDGASLDVVACETTGVLEHRIATRVKAALVVSGGME